MGLTEFLAGYITAFIAKAGYGSVFLLMTMESMVFPIPSEAVMPFAGFLITEGKFSFAAVIAFSTLGSIVGSVLSYAMGAWGGKPFIAKFGRFFLLNSEDLAWTERFFARFGDATIFISRFIPIVRHLISIPAGSARMNFWRFLVYTIVGAGLWNAILTWAGMYLRQNWEAVMKYSRLVDIAVLALLVAGVIFFIVKHLQVHTKKVQ